MLWCSPSFAEDYTNHFDIPAKLIQQCASKKTFAQFPQVKTSFTSAKGFTVKLSGVTGSQPTEAAIRPLLTPQLDKAGSSVIFEWLKVLLKHFPDVFTWVPPSGGDNEKFCLVQNQCAWVAALQWGWNDNPTVDQNLVCEGYSYFICVNNNGSK